MELNEEKLQLLEEVFGDAQLMLRSDSRRGYAKLNAPGLYSFEVPAEGERSTGNTRTEPDETALESWTMEPEPAIELDMITEEEQAQMGVLQRDRETGELYMLLPLEVNALIEEKYLDLDEKQQLEVKLPQLKLNFELTFAVESGSESESQS